MFSSFCFEIFIIYRCQKNYIKCKKKKKEIQCMELIKKTILNHFIIHGSGVRIAYVCTYCYYTEFYLRKCETSRQYMIKHVQASAPELFNFFKTELRTVAQSC